MQAFECINKIFQELQEPPLTNAEFKKINPNIDFNSDGKFTLKEISDYISKFVNRQEILLVGLYWVGWSINPNEKKNKDEDKKNTMHDTFMHEEVSTFYKEIFAGSILQVNNEGHLFRLSEWAADITRKGKNTFVVLMDDYDQDEKHLALQ